MKRLTKPLYTTLLLVVTLHAPGAAAQIYKWVDENGNVHFGDKPRDAGKASAAQEVEVKEAYTPSEQPGAPENSQLQSEEALKKSHEIRRQEQREREEAEKAAAAAKKEKKQRYCTELETEYRKLTEMHLIDGRRTYYYIKGKDGKSVTASEQRRYVEGLEKKAEEAGCSFKSQE